HEGAPLISATTTAGARISAAGAGISAAPSDEPALGSNAQASARARGGAQARRASTSRRFVDPSTCDRNCTAAELEFTEAMQAYKKSSGRMFPTWSEVLEILQGLGYRKAN